MAVYQFNSCQYDSSDGSLRNRDTDTSRTLRPQLALLLEHFLANPGQVIPRDDLCLAVWGPDAVVDFESGLAALIRELRQALNDCGNPPDILETVPRRGYRFLVEPELTGALPNRRWSSSWRWPLVAGAVVLLVGIGAGALVWLWPSPTPETARSPALAILPFERFGDRDALPEHVDLLLADALLARLWQAELANLALIGRTSIRPYAALDNPGEAVARDLNVNLLIEGSAFADDETWRVEVRLLMLPEGRVVWSTSVERPANQRLPAGEVADEAIRDLAERWPDILEDTGFRQTSD